LAAGALPGYPEFMPIPVLDHADALQRIAKHEREIRELGASRLALFGSVLRGTPREESDVDLLVQFRPGMKTYDRFPALSELLERCLERRVELVTIEALSPFIGPRILQQAEDVLRAA
jgi:predicted nucleotidyltransferase